MDEKLYAKRETVQVDGGDVEIPVISTHPEHQDPYRRFRQQGMAHAAAEALADDAWQTRHYEHFVAIALRADGRLIQIPVYSPHRRTQQAYAYLRSMGESHNSADMTISRKGPGIGLCDTVMLKGSLMHNQFAQDPQRYEQFRKKALAYGVNPTGKFYHPGLGLELGDPEAWVGSIDDVKQVCKRRGWKFGIKDGEMDIGIPADIGQRPRHQFRSHAKRVKARPKRRGGKR